MNKRKMDTEKDQTTANIGLHKLADAHCARCYNSVEIGIVTLKKIYGDDLEIPDQQHRLRCSHCGNYEVTLTR